MLRNLESMGLCKLGYPSETHVNLKSRRMLCVHNIRAICPIVLKFCSRPNNVIAVLCAEFQIRLGRISYIAQPPEYESEYNESTQVYFRMNIRLYGALANRQRRKSIIGDNRHHCIHQMSLIARLNTHNPTYNWLMRDNRLLNKKHGMIKCADLHFPTYHWADCVH